MNTPFSYYDYNFQTLNSLYGMQQGYTHVHYSMIMVLVQVRMCTHIKCIQERQIMNNIHMGKTIK